MVKIALDVFGMFREMSVLMLKTYILGAKGLLIYVHEISPIENE